MNPITIYLVFNLVNFDDFANRLVGGPIQKTLGVWGDVLHALVVVGIMLALVGFLFGERSLFAFRILILRRSGRRKPAVSPSAVLG